MLYDKGRVVGKATLGWTVGEEVLFNRAMHLRPETAVCDREACLLGIPAADLTAMQAELLADNNPRDYFAIESVLKGNHLLKEQWRK